MKHPIGMGFSPDGQTFTLGIGVLPGEPYPLVGDELHFTMTRAQFESFLLTMMDGAREHWNVSFDSSEE